MTVHEFLESLSLEQLVLLGQALEKDAAKTKMWIQKAIQRPGALHRKMGIPEGEKIPTEDLKAKYLEAKKSGDTKTMRQVAFALILRGEEVPGGTAKKRKPLYKTKKK